jgi:uncharacterized protein YkwD
MVNMSFKNRVLFSVSLISIIAPLLSIPSTSYAANTPIKIDNFSRESVISSYRNILEPTLKVPVGWTGNIQGCKKGTTTAANKEASLTALNYIRTLQQLKPVTINVAMSRYAQASALISSANQFLTHHPTSRMLCYSRDGYWGSNRGNIAYVSGNYQDSEPASATGARAVIEYMADEGSSNKPVGHRRWLSYTRLTEVGFGDTNNSNAIVVAGGKLRKAENQWVMWPMHGYFPRELEPRGRWSISYPGADFRNAQVSVKSPAGFIKVQKLGVKNGYADNTLSWEVKLPKIYSTNKDDFKVDVYVSRIKYKGKWITRTYSVTLISAANKDQFPQPGQASANETQTSDASTTNSSSDTSDTSDTNSLREPRPEELAGYIRPQVTFLGTTSCTRTDEGWLMKNSWKVSGGNYIGKYYDQNSGLKRVNEIWIIDREELFASAEPPQGKMYFDYDGYTIWFMAMNGTNYVIDDYWFPGVAVVDATSVCK